MSQPLSGGDIKMWPFNRGDCMGRFYWLLCNIFASVYMLYFILMLFYTQKYRSVIYGGWWYFVMLVSYNEIIFHIYRLCLLSSYKRHKL
jgi:hypothetical protein